MFDAFLKSEVSRLGLPGLAVAFSQHGREQFAAGYGHCDPACKKPITPDTPFGIASVSKLVTAIEVMRLLDKKRLSLLDPVSQYYPELVVAAESGMQLHHLLSHSTGLPGLSSRFFAVNLQNTDDTSGGVGKSDSLNSVKNLPVVMALLKATDLPDFINAIQPVPLAAPGVLLNYSNESFCLLGGIIEKLTAKSYQRHVEQSAFRALDMTHSFVGYDSKHCENIALPLQRDKNSALSDAGVWDAPLFYPAGGVVASARDLNKLVSVLSENNEFLSSRSRESLRQPAISVASRPDESIGYGHALEFQSLDANTTLHWHTGQRAGVSSFVAWVSGPAIAVSVLSNIADAPVAGIGFALITQILKRTDLVWPQLSDKPAKDAATMTEEDIKHLQGRYISSEGFDVRIYQADNTLLLATDNNPVGKPLDFNDKESGIVGEQSFRFLMHKGAIKEPWALALDLRILPLEKNN